MGVEIENDDEAMNAKDVAAAIATIFGTWGSTQKLNNSCISALESIYWTTQCALV